MQSGYIEVFGNIQEYRTVVESEKTIFWTPGCREASLGAEDLN
jgi:hypothetical protein